jgi:hypothetical protein
MAFRYFRDEPFSLPDQIEGPRQEAIVDGFAGRQNVRGIEQMLSDELLAHGTGIDPHESSIPEKSRLTSVRAAGTVMA